MKSKILRAMLTVGLIASMTVPTMAADVTATQDVSTSGSKTPCTVTINGGASTFSVTIPKTISGTGKSGTLSYEVTVTGDFAGSEQVSVTPDASFTLSQEHKSDVTATVSQDKTVWLIDELATKGAGTITYTDLPSGTWTGSFNFNITLADIV